MTYATNVNLINRRDLDFLLYEWLDVESLLGRERFVDHDRETVDAVLDLCERLAVDRFLPHYRESDSVEPRFTDDGVHVLPAIRRALHECADVGLFAAPFEKDIGGLQMPQVVFSACESILMSANISTSAYLMLTVANARLLAAFGTPEQIDTFSRPQVEGRTLGTMCLSEPQAGSSLADIRTRATPDGSDRLGRRYRLEGNKMWISGGDHDITENIVHLVLAKVPGSDGRMLDDAKSISLFIVPKLLPEPSGAGDVKNDIAVAGLNHKMGYRGTSNCLLNFGEGAHLPQERAGAVGYLVGEVGQGLAIMFHMMNEGRIGVGLGAAMLGYRGYLHALQYAKERVQGRPLRARGDKSATGPVAIIEHPDVKRMLMAQKSYVEGALALVLYCSRLVDEQQSHDDPEVRELAGSMLDLLTPVAKTWPSEYGLAANDLAIQVHGGYGYTRDFDVEQLYRDNRLNPIHEGTTGIQAIDLLGRKILRDRGAAVARLFHRIEATMERARGHERLSDHAMKLGHVWDRIAQTSKYLIALDDNPRALENATSFQSAFGHAVVGWLWLDKACSAEQALVSGKAPSEYYEGKVRACRYFFETELPRTDQWLDPVDALSDVSADMPVDCF